MLNFNFHNPIKILFGEGKVAELSHNIPAGAKILMVYGGGSIKKNGVYEQVKEALSDYEVLEFSGVEPNPRYETAMKAVEIVKNENIDFLLAVGGGSVVDATKFIAAAAKYEGAEPWNIIAKSEQLSGATPLGVVLTLPATGTEMNKNSVITRESTQEKLAFYSPYIMPLFSVLDPTFTYSLPQRQVVNGIVDAYVHVLEQYMTYPVDSPIQDRFAESILITLIEEGRKAMSLETPDYNNRANIVWSATMALNGLIASGVKECWGTHKIGHELTAFHGLDHAVTLAIVLPGFMNAVRNLRTEKLVQLAERVWGIKEGSDSEKIDKLIVETESFFRELGIKTRLGEHNIGQETIDRIVARFKSRGFTYLPNLKDLEIEKVGELLAERI